MEHLDRQVESAEGRLKNLTKDDRFVQRLLGWKGVGLVTAAMLRAEMGEMGRFRSGKHLSRYCGLSPRNASSGQKQAHAGLIKAGNAELRSIVIEASHRLQRFDPRWKALVAQLRGRRKKGSVVTAAVANRWVRWLYHQLQEPLAASGGSRSGPVRDDDEAMRKTGRPEADFEGRIRGNAVVRDPVEIR